MAKIENYKFSNITELLDFLAPWRMGTSLDGYVFRGHSQEKYNLVPTALREDKNDHLWQCSGQGKPVHPQADLNFWQLSAEYQTLRQFYRLSDQRGLDVPLAEKMRKNLAQDFDYMGTMERMNGAWIPDELQETAALAQHYGLPTRLLDWTYDLYVAMYFAFRGAIGKTGNIVIWAINKEHLSFLKPTISKVEVDFITPHYAGNPHLNAQKGLFTLWPTITSPANAMTKVDRRPLDELIFSQLESDDVNIFKRFTLPCAEAVKGCSFLDNLGYDSARIFPGYGGVAEQINTKHTYAPNVS
ncbi:FRG domain-containing protein [Pseudomonas juntendi]|uniref:FRG domain-containing protein n=1 Tax=Pseudomonas juntendi TaxID=2666183 RepID=UPI001F2A0C70|nr:FRG domain-containing protein [Pseudomonas juntendi]